MTTKTTSSKRSATKDSKEESAPVDQTVTEQTTGETQAVSPKEADTSAKGSKSSKNTKTVSTAPATPATETAPVSATSSKTSKAPAKAAKAVAPAKASASKGTKASKTGTKDATLVPADATSSPTIKAPKHLKVAKKNAKGGAEQQGQGGQGEEEEQVPGKRYFKCIMIDGDGNAVSNGRYSGKKPKQAASKACTRLYDDMKKSGQTPEQIIFGMHECTRANKKKKKYFYVGKRIALDEPEEVTIKKSDGKQMVIQYHFNNDVRKLTDLENCQEYVLLANYDAKRNENGEEIVVEPVKKARGGAKRGKAAGKAKKATGTGKNKKADAKKVPKVKGTKASKATSASEAVVDQQAAAVEPAKQATKVPKAAKKQPAKPAKKETNKPAKPAKPTTKQAKA